MHGRTAMIGVAGILLPGVSCPACAAIWKIMPIYLCFLVLLGCSGSILTYKARKKRRRHVHQLQIFKLIQCTRLARQCADCRLPPSWASSTCHHGMTPAGSGLRTTNTSPSVSPAHCTLSCLSDLQPAAPISPFVEHLTICFCSRRQPILSRPRHLAALH